MSRQDCLAWWKERCDQPLERSACVACPFQSRSRWVETKQRWPKLFREAVDIDASLRGKLAFAKEPYLHPLRIPLAEAVRHDEAALGAGGQSDGFGNECEGRCGVRREGRQPFDGPPPTGVRLEAEVARRCANTPGRGATW